MKSSTAEIVDLEAHRRLRSQAAEAAAAQPLSADCPVAGFASFMVPVTFVMVWSPMMFIPMPMMAGSDGSFTAA